MTRSMLVKDYMSRKLVTFTPELGLLRAAHILISNNISGAPVLDKDGRLVGMLTERDCMRVAIQADYYGVPGGLVSDNMSVNPQFVNPGDSILDLAQLFQNGRFHRYPVVDKTHLVGVISRRDVMRALGEFYPL